MNATHAFARSLALVPHMMFGRTSSGDKPSNADIVSLANSLARYPDAQTLHHDLYNNSTALNNEADDPDGLLALWPSIVPRLRRGIAVVVNSEVSTLMAKKGVVLMASSLMFLCNAPTSHGLDDILKSIPSEYKKAARELCDATSIDELSERIRSAQHNMFAIYPDQVQDAMSISTFGDGSPGMTICFKQLPLLPLVFRLVKSAIDIDSKVQRIQ